MAYKLIDHYKFEWTKPDGSVMEFEIETYQDEYPYEAGADRRGKSLLYPSNEKFFATNASNSEEMAIHEMKTGWGSGGSWKKSRIF